MRLSNHHIIEQVPPNYYQEGIKNNFLQRFWHTNKLREVINLISSSRHRSKKILDVGCASGWLLSKIKAAFPTSICYGIDVFNTGIEYGSRLYPRLKLKTADAHKIPYQNNSFDTVICTEVIEHVDKPERVLREIKRVLKEDGKAIIELDSGVWTFSIVWYIWKKFKGKVWNDSHLHTFNVKKLEKSLKKCGFKILDKKTFNFGMAMIFLAGK